MPNPAIRVMTEDRIRGENDRAFEWLERAYAEHDSALTNLKGDPLLKSLEPDPRYAALLKKMRLPP